jgi:hypothetical protein
MIVCVVVRVFVIYAKTVRSALKTIVLVAILAKTVKNATVVLIESTSVVYARTVRTALKTNVTVVILATTVQIATMGT